MTQEKSGGKGDIEISKKRYTRTSIYNKEET